MFDHPAVHETPPTAVHWRPICRAAAVLLALLCTFTPAAQAASPLPGEIPQDTDSLKVTEPSATFSDRIDVRRKLLEVRVVDGLGRPVEGLGPEDFRVRLGGREARVEAVDRVVAESYDRHRIETSPSSLPDASPTLDSGAARAFDPAIAEPRQLVLLFCQSTRVASKTPGFLRLHRHLDEMLDTMPADVAAAVVAFDSHLKLHQDFTTDRAALKDAVERCFGHFPAEFPDPPVGDTPSLTRHISGEVARKIAFADDALAQVAHALAPLPGEKALIYVGWGLGNLGRGGVSFSGTYLDAREALVNARIPAFVLDVAGNWDYHAQELSLRAFADQTGGQYFHTYTFPSREVHRVERILAGGRYLLLVEVPDVEPGWRDLDVTLRDRWKYRRVLAPEWVEIFADGI